MNFEQDFTKLWSCHLCTFQNSPNTDSCAMCQQLKPLNYKGIQKRDNAMLNYWKCSKCTYLNSLKSNNCVICKNTNHWKCTECTYLNSIQSSICVVCKNSVNVQMNKIENPKLSNVQNSSHFWKCIECTYLNSLIKPNCVLCNHKNELYNSLIDTHDYWELVLDTIEDSIKSKYEEYNVLRVLRVILYNLLTDDIKYRSILCNDENIKNKVLKYNGGLEFLNGLGFKKFNEKLICKNPNKNVINLALKTLKNRLLLLESDSEVNNRKESMSDEMSLYEEPKLEDKITASGINPHENYHNASDDEKNEVVIKHRARYSRLQVNNHSKLKLSKNEDTFDINHLNTPQNIVNDKSDIKSIRSDRTSTISIPVNFKFKDTKYMKEPYIIIIGISDYSNSDKSGKSNLPATKNDVKKLTKLFYQKYEYKHVVSIMDYIDSKKTEKIDEDNLIQFLYKQRDEIDKICNNNKTTVDGVMIFYGGHGNGKGILLGNGDLILYKELCDIFSNKSLPNLCNKPKLLYFDCCRGRSSIKKMKIKQNLNDRNLELKEENEINNNNNIMKFTNKYNDIMITYATISGIKAYDDNKYGHLSKSIYVVYKDIKNMKNLTLYDASLRIKSLVNYYSKSNQSCEIVCRLDYHIKLISSRD